MSLADEKITESESEVLLPALTEGSQSMRLLAEYGAAVVAKQASADAAAIGTMRLR